ncbi:MAG TPA: hypothetical protein VM915_04570, partial [Verrucomicrobiae bacterium]|nr:hypothetical protein [Verrucomicrobiae bacterium]
MRWAILAATIATVGYAGATNNAFAAPEAAAAEAPASAIAQGVATSELLRSTSPPNAAADRTYTEPQDALKQADIDYLVHEGRRQLADGSTDAIWIMAVFADDMAAGRYNDAREVLRRSPGGLNSGMADMLEPFLLAAEGRVDRGAERVDASADNLPAPLPEVARALVFESAGRLQEAAAIYALMIERLDTTPPGDDEPQTTEEFERALSAPRVTHAVYRAALVSHRLGRREEAQRYYDIVRGFSPRSADLEANVARLQAGQPPFEAALTPVSATGRWLLFLSEYLTQAEMLQQLLSQQGPQEGFASVNGAALLQIGVLLAGDANDWRLYAAQQALGVPGGVDGAQRIIDQLQSDSVFAADAEIVRASILLERNNDDAAIVAAERALGLAGDRWGVIASVGDIYRRAGHADRAIPAFNRALEMAQTPKDRADVLGWRAYAHRFAGNVSAATADARAAYEIDQSVDTRLLYVSILMDDPNGWREGVAMARALFA